MVGKKEDRVGNLLVDRKDCSGGSRHFDSYGRQERLECSVILRRILCSVCDSQDVILLDMYWAEFIITGYLLVDTTGCSGGSRQGNFEFYALLFM